jgi:SAM-dependent methyltransferase
VLRARLCPVHAPGGPGLTGGRRPGCDPGCGCAANEFGERDARNDLKKLRKSGPATTTRWLIDALSVGGVEGWSVLDIGAGVGAVHLELLAAGAAEALDIDASPAYVAAARSEAARRGSSDRVRHEVGDFVAMAADIEPADVVALDRVVCCYRDMAALVTLSAERARRRYGLVYPRDSWWIRTGARVMNAVAGLFRSRIRFYAHRTADVDGLVRAAGLEPRFRRTTTFWQVAVYERPTP